MTVKVGIAGLGAIGSAVARALVQGIDGYELVAAANLTPVDEFDIPLMNFSKLSETCDLVIECLPPHAVPLLAREVFSCGKDFILISACALLIHPEILTQHKLSDGRIIVPSGALAGIDAVLGLSQMGIESAKIATTKPPKGYMGAPYIEQKKIDLTSISEKQLLFSGNALEAAQGFPANVNVAATLSFAGIGPEKTQVEIWADPDAAGNAHEITVTSAFSTLTARIENKPDPSNPKTSLLAAQSIIAVLKGMSGKFVVL